ncbi:MAG: hypothetical protein F6K39_17690 [Okeania sp. SIO3B3]|nr:hypothetical protein [Okeania sp. SIO3B3]
MSEKIKILMLGDGRSGKTCYMLGMYAAMPTNSKFSLKATDPDQGTRLSASWSTIVNGLDTQRWPPGTDQPKTYNFEFSYGYKPLIEFEWLDYRGTSMSSLSISSEDNVEALRDYANQCNGLFFCISGEYLSFPINNANITRIITQTKADRMANYLQDLGVNRRPDEKKSFPIVILVTKYDYCFHRPKEELIEDVKQMFLPLFAQNSGWLVMICPTSLGKELAQDRAKGTIEPFNLHVPVAFLLYCVLGEKARSQDEKARIIADKLDEWEDSNPIVQWMNRVKIRELEKSLEQMENQLQNTKEMMNILAREQDLSSTHIYMSGKRVKIDLS